MAKTSYQKHALYQVLIYLLAPLKSILFAMFDYAIVKVVLNYKSVFTLPCCLQDLKGLIDIVDNKISFVTYLIM